MPNEAATKAKRRRPQKLKPSESCLKKLGPQHVRFIEELLLDPAHPADCAARAGFKGNRLNTRAYKLQNDPLIAAELEKRRAVLAKRMEVTAERVIQELARIGFSKMTDFARVVTKDYTDEKGEPRSFKAVEITETDELNDDQAAALAEVSETLGQSGRTLKVKLHDKVRALDLLGKHLGLWDKKELDPNRDVDWMSIGKTFAEAIEGINERPEGDENGA